MRQSYAYGEPIGYIDADIYTDCDGNSYAYADSDCYGNSHIHAYGDSNSYAYADSYSYGDSNCDAYTDSYSYSYSYGYTHGDVRANHWHSHHQGWRAPQHHYGQHCYPGNKLVEREWSEANRCQPIRKFHRLRNRRSFSDDEPALDLWFRTACSLECWRIYV
jgi:hypothetical protein